MDITPHITDLLFNHECVIIHGFGGFISNRMSSVLNENENLLFPPKANLAFNTDLRANDGLLANYISNIEQISYKDALSEIKKWTDHANEELQIAKLYKVGDIGILKLNTSGRIEFEPFQILNFNANAYGLPTLKVAPIGATMETPDLVTAQTAQKYDFIRKKSRTIPETLKWAAVLAPFIAFSIWGALHKEIIGDYVNNHSGIYAWVKFSKAKPEHNKPTVADTTANSSSSESPGSIMAEHNAPYTPALLAYRALAKNNIVVENQSATSIGVANEKTDNPQAEMNAVSSEYACYIIAGLFSNEKNAHNLLDELKTKGLANADIVMQGEKYMVRIQGYASRAEAQEDLLRVRMLGYEDAWVMKRSI